MYFTWTKYPFQQPPELAGKTSNFQVAVIGAGPVGLALALGLARQNVRVVVIEARDSVSEGSRAIGIARRSIQMMDYLGLGDIFMSTASVRETNMVYHGHDLVYTAPYDQSKTEKRPELAVLQQCWMEKILLDALQQQPTAEIRWLSKLVGVKNEAGHAALEVETEAGSYSMNVDYVAASDGARGTVRRLFNLQYENPVPEQISDRSFIIVDFEMETTLPVARRLWLNPPYKPGSVAIMQKQPFNTWRLDYALDADEDVEEQLRHENVAKRVGAQVALLDQNATWKILWSSTYRARSRSLPIYRQQRVFFVGDAAHQTPIFGGRGLNLGYADAMNLSWRLAYVLHGHAPASMLDQYDAERRPLVVQTLLDLAQATIFMTNPSPGVEVMRDAVLALTHTETFVRELFDAFSAKRTDAYQTEKLGTQAPGNYRLVGGPLPDTSLVRAREVDAPNPYLYDLLGHGFTGIHVCASGEVAPGVADALKNLERGDVPFKSVVLGLKDGAHISALAEQAALDKLGVADGTFLLVRPDRHVAAVLVNADADAIRDAWTRMITDQDMPAVAMLPAVKKSDHVSEAFQSSARALDEIGLEHTQLFLSNLVLLLAEAVGDTEKIKSAVGRAITGNMKRAGIPATPKSEGNDDASK